MEARPPAAIIMIVSPDDDDDDQCNDDNHRKIQTQKNNVCETCSQVKMETEMGSVVKRGMNPKIPYMQLCTYDH